MLARLHLIGTSHRLLDPSELARLPSGDEARALAAQAIAGGLLAGAVVLATCNRFEFYVEAEAAGGDGLEDLRAVFGALPLYERHGRAAARHLFRVAGSLDSMVLGENQILGQVRKAWEAARARGESSPLLDMAFQEALTAAKEIRTKTGLGEKPVSVASIGCRELVEVLRARRIARPRIAFAGAGVMIRKAARALAADGGDFVFANRTIEKAEALAREFGGRVLPLAELLAEPPQLDAVVVAVRGREPLLDAGFAGRRPDPAAPLAVLDLGMPPCSAPGLAEKPGVTRIDLAALQERSRRHAAARREAARAAEPIAARHVLALARRLSTRGLDLDGVRRRHLALAEEGFAELVAKEMPFLDEEARGRLKRRFLRLAKAHAHLHLKDLKVLAAEA